MKKIISILLVTVMLLSILTGCDSADYKKAQNLYAEGNYAEAAAIFAELGDYEDSKQMVTACAYGEAAVAFEKGDYETALAGFTALGDYEDAPERVTACNYQIALAAYENGDFATALSLFTQLGDYEDAADRRYDAGWYALCDYIQENGEVSDDLCMLKLVGDSTVTYLAIYEGNREQLMLYTAKLTDLGFFKGTDSCGLFIDRGSLEASYILSSDSQTTVNGMTGVVQQQASGTLDISTITTDTVPERTNYTYYLRDIYGNESTRTTPDAVALSGAQSAFSIILAEIPAILADTGLGITLQDLGFTSLG